jgi:hypothetical protein
MHTAFAFFTFCCLAVIFQLHMLYRVKMKWEDDYEWWLIKIWMEAAADNLEVIHGYRLDRPTKTTEDLIQVDL